MIGAGFKNGDFISRFGFISLTIFRIQFQDLVEIGWGLIRLVSGLEFLGHFVVEFDVIRIGIQFVLKDRKGVDSCGEIFDRLEGFIHIVLSAETDKTVDFLPCGIDKKNGGSRTNAEIFPVLGKVAFGVLG